MGCRCSTLGQVPTGRAVTSATAGALMTAAPFTGPAAPFVAGIAGALGFFSTLFGFGHDPSKLNDTAVTEAFRIGMNAMWNDLTGDSLPTACDPGQCGNQRVAIFEQSPYPNVPYPAGRPGIDPIQFIAALERAHQEALSKLQRSESAAGLDQNYRYMGGLLRRVLSERARQAPLQTAISTVSSVIPRTPEGGIDFLKLAPWAGAGYLLYKFV